MTEYVVGFLHDGYRVVLIEKNRPDWQAGLLNGVGGKIEKYDLYPIDAMRREFKEETGVTVQNWQHFLTLRGQTNLVWCYVSKAGPKKVLSVKTTTDEPVRVYHMDGLSERHKTVPNLKWIIPLMRQCDKYGVVTVNFYGD